MARIPKLDSAGRFLAADVNAQIDARTKATMRADLPALAKELKIGGVDGSVPIFPTLAEAQAWEAANPGKTALTLEASTPDTTPPSAAGTLTVTTLDRSASLSVSGAVDDRAVTGYAFSKDGGVTYSAWQPSPSYTFTGLTASTAYQFRHKVRDAAGNERVGGVVSATTLAKAPAWEDLFTESFDGAQGTDLVGTTTDTGGGTWAGTAGKILLDGAGNAVWDTHPQTVSAYVSLGGATTAKIRVSVTYDLTQHTTAGSVSQAGVQIHTNSTFNNALYALVGSNGSLAFTDYAAGVWTYTGTTTGFPATGTLTMEFDPAAKSGSLSVNGTQAGTFTGDAAVSAYSASLMLGSSTAKASSWKVEKFS